jgi:hypothetical protein
MHPTSSLGLLSSLNLPKLCQNGCNRIANAGSLVVYNGQDKKILSLCKVCRKTMLKGKSPAIVSNPSAAIVSSGKLKS